jgi:hypothetical protein
MPPQVKEENELYEFPTTLEVRLRAGSAAGGCSPPRRRQTAGGLPRRPYLLIQPSPGAAPSSHFERGAPPTPPPFSTHKTRLLFNGTRTHTQTYRPWLWRAALSCAGGGRQVEQRRRQLAQAFKAQARDSRIVYSAYGVRRLTWASMWTQPRG